MDKNIEFLKKISHTPLHVYIGEGVYDDLSVQLHDGLDDKRIQSISNKLPSEYIELLKFSNGMI